VGVVDMGDRLGRKGSEDNLGRTSGCLVRTVERHRLAEVAHTGLVAVQLAGSQWVAVEGRPYVAEPFPDGHTDREALVAVLDLGHSSGPPGGLARLLVSAGCLLPSCVLSIPFEYL